MSKTKIIILSIVFFVVIVGGLLAYVMFFAQPEKINEVDESKATATEISAVNVSNRYAYNEVMVTDEMLSDALKILNSSNENAMWVEDENQRDGEYYICMFDPEGTTSCKLYEASDEYLQKKIYEFEEVTNSYYTTKYDGAATIAAQTPMTNIEDVKEVAVNSIERLTKSQKSGSKNCSAWCSDQWDGENGIKAFKDMYMYDGDYLNENGQTFFDENGLSLNCKNVKLEKIATGNNMLIACNYYAVISADVTCKENSGTFKDLKWIPDEAETNHVEFVMIFGAVNQTGHKMCYIYELDVIDYKVIN